MNWKIETTAEEQNKKNKQTNKVRAVFETSGTIVNATTFGLWGPLKKKSKKKNV